MTISIPGVGVSASPPAQTPGSVFASKYTPGTAFNNPRGEDDTAALNAALSAARAVTTLGNNIGVLVLDAACYFVSGPLNCYQVKVIGAGPGGTRIVPTVDWCASLPCNAGQVMDMQPSVALGAPTQTAATQASGTSAYTASQAISAWVTASNARNGGETPVSGMQQITIATNGNAPTFHWTAISNADGSTTYNVYLSRTGSTDPTAAIKVASGQTGTSYTDATGTGGSGHPPTVDTTGGVGITCPDYSRIGAAPNYGAGIERIYLLGGGLQSAGVVGWHLSGIHQGVNTEVRRVVVNGLFAGLMQNTDHEKLYSSNLGCYYSVYRSGPAGSGGDEVFEDIEMKGAWASFGVAADASLSGAHFRKVHCAAPPFGFYKEQNVIGGGSFQSVFLGGNTFDELTFESTGNGNIFVAGSASADVTKSVFNGCSSVNGLDPGVKLALATTDWQGVAITRANAAIDINGGNWYGNSVWGNEPANLHPSAVYTTGIVAKFGQGGIYEMTSLLNKVSGDGKPFSTGNPGSADSLIVTNGCFCRIYRAAGSVTAGQLVQISGGGQPQVAVSDGTTRAAGYAVCATGAGGACLVAYSGVVTLGCTNAISAGAVVVPDGTNHGQVTGGTLSSTNIVGSALQASSAGTVQVLLQGLG